MTSSSDPSWVERHLRGRKFPWFWMITAAVTLLLGAWLASCGQESSKSKTVTTKETAQSSTQAASAASAPVAAASQVFPPPAAAVPGVIKDEKETVVSGACLSAEEVKKVIREACEPKKPAVVKEKQKRSRSHVAVVPQVPVVIQEPVKKTPVVVGTNAECAWIHPHVAYDQSPTPLAGKRFDKPANYPGNCKQFVDEIAHQHGFPTTRKISD